MGLGIRKGRKEAKENLEDIDELDEQFKERREQLDKKVERGPPPTFRRDEELISEFKQEISEGKLKGVLGIDKNISKEQQQSLNRLEDKWLSGLQGTFNAATEERKPLMISFDDDDNILETRVASITIEDNDFDGGEEIRLEYPKLGTEFYNYDETNETGWRKGKTVVETARNIVQSINRRSKFVFAQQEAATITLEMRNDELDPASLVLFVEDPGGTDITAEKGGVNLDPRKAEVLEDYEEALRLVLEDGIISPSEDQMLWAMRQYLDIDDSFHVHLVQTIFGDEAVKECTYCGGMADLYPEYSAWYCSHCENWV